MSKLSSEVVVEAVQSILKNSEIKKRNFLETVELQIGLKNYDPRREKRFSGNLVLPLAPRTKFKVCVLANDKDFDKAQAIGVDALKKEDLKKMKNNKKLVKKLAKKYDAFLGSSTIVRQVPRLLGPGLNKAGKFPVVITPTEDIAAKITQMQATIKFQLKSKVGMSLGVPVGNVSMSEDELVANIILAVNHMASLLPKNFQNIKRLYVKSTMGPSERIYGF